MEQILIRTHKQNVQYIAKRFPVDVVRFQDLGDSVSGLQVATDMWSVENVVLWIKDERGNVIAEVSRLTYPGLNLDRLLAALPASTLSPEVKRIQGKYFVFICTSLVVQGESLGMLIVAQDITAEQTMFLMLVKHLWVMSFIVLSMVAIGLSLYIRRSLQPLREMSQLAGAISPQNLHEAQLTLQAAPQEVQELAQACNLMLARLSDSWEQQRQLVGNVSHELRTPLTIVQGYIQCLLRRGDNLTDTQREALMVAETETERTTRLLQDLLDLARAESGFLHLDVGEFSLQELLLETVMMSVHISQRHINLVELSPPVNLCGDRNRIKQVLINLIDNGLKYSPDQSVITIEPRQVNDYIEIDIIDEGDGIPLTQQSRIFDRFYRVDEARTRSGGSGLGLAIVKTLLTQMGGNITVQSQPQQGSTFTITLPLKFHPHDRH